MIPYRADVGRRAEIAVADCLFTLGFQVLVRNLRLGPLELDVVARKDRLLVVTEVRTRGPGSFVGPFASVTRTKRARLVKAAQRLWRSRRDHEWMNGVDRLRIDVAAVTFKGRETHIEYAPGALG